MSGTGPMNKRKGKTFFALQLKVFTYGRWSLTRGQTTGILNLLNPKIKIQFLLSCSCKFIIAVAGRSCEYFKTINLG